MEKEIYPVVRYTTLKKGRLEYHSAYDCTPLQVTDLRSGPFTKDIIYPKSLR